MERELLTQIEPLARLLLTPQQIGEILGLSDKEVDEFRNPWSETGKMYRKIIAEKAKELHEKTLRLAEVGSPTALEEANGWLRTAQISIE